MRKISLLKRLHNAPLLICSAALALGMFVAEKTVNPDSSLQVTIALCISIALLLACFFIKKEAINTILLLATIASVGATLAYFNIQRTNRDVFDNGNSQPITFTVVRLGNQTPKTQQVTAYSQQHRANIRLAINRQNGLPRIGQTYEARTRCTPVTWKNSADNGFLRWLWRQGIQAQGYVHTMQPTTTPSLPFRTRVCIRGAKAQRQLSRYLTHPIAKAIILGDKTQLSKTTKNNFSQAGTAHLLALSGLHLSIIATFLTILLPRRRAKANAAIIITFVWLYALITGAAVPICRAATMMTIIVLASAFQRQHQSLNNLGLAACILLCANPARIADISTVLSFVSVLAIILLAPYITSNNKLTRREKILFGIRESIIVSVVAQLAVLPFVGYTFHQIQFYAPLANLIAIPLTYLIILLSITLLLLHPIPVIGSAIAWLANLLCCALDRWTAWIVTLPYAACEWEINMTQAVCITIILSALCFIVLKCYIKPLKKWKIPN